MSRLDPAAIYQLARNGLANQFLTKPGRDVNPTQRTTQGSCLLGPGARRVRLPNRV